ncbi:MAG: NAD-dependent epimerase/dehydratase family protein, partial [Candidatus Omnitrophica bacterium]|nr:NAD-dependent epimerase/dehydratase family protein [Candidatus Omnitrophota bacterium]
NNTGYSQKIAEWCVSQNVYLGYASSAATYGDGSLGFSDEDTLTPRLKALNPYGQSKLDFDIWVLKQGLQNRLVGFRFFNVYGPNEYHKGHMRSLVDKGFEQVRSTGKLRLFKSYRKEYADGGQKRDFLYVKDAVEAMLWFYGHPEIKGIYNLGQGKAQSWNELADALFKASAKPLNVEYVDMPEAIKDQYQYFTQADLSKFKKTGCPVRFSDLEAGVRDYVQNHLAQPDPYL